MHMSSRIMGHESRWSTPLDEINKRRMAHTRNDILSSRSAGSGGGYLATRKTFCSTCAMLHHYLKFALPPLHNSAPRLATPRIYQATNDDMFTYLKTCMNQELEAEESQGQVSGSRNSQLTSQEGAAWKKDFGYELFADLKDPSGFDKFGTKKQKRRGFRRR
ncbi:hypothetical protein AC579_2303 [Pseudocercospora musae]|uniref:Uncharacterized protein n=1 Tax=Pseudocercospora musae TaxID=113226 RepID=A0A139IUS3_9PEZI|nr:hypothetical protein AC579_2303 [Pseudocercospora musae]